MILPLVQKEDILETLLDMCKTDTSSRKLGTVLGNTHVIWYFHPEPVEEILSSNQHISKSSQYIPLLVCIYYMVIQGKL